MPYRTVTYTFDPTTSGGYDFAGTYYTPASTDVSNDEIDGQVTFATFNTTNIEQIISSLDYVSSVVLSYTLSNDDFIIAQNIQATDLYYSDINYQSTVEAETDAPAGNSDGSYVFQDLYGPSGATVGSSNTTAVYDTTVNTSYDVSSDVSAAAAAGRDLVVAFASDNAAGDAGLTHVSNEVITVTGEVAYDLPTITGTIANQSVTAGSTIDPFSSVTIGDPANIGGSGDDITLTIVDSNGDGTDALGTLSLPAADSVSGQGLTFYGDGNYELGPVTSIATLRSELNDLVFTPAADATGATLDFAVQSSEGGATTATVTVSRSQSYSPPGGPSYSPPCYCPGTLILTDRGERPVETLAIGDTVLTSAGRRRPVRWIGRRSYAGPFLAANRALLPIRFRAGSLGGGLPHRDLLVSPAHAMLLDGLLIPARCLVNGATIVQERGLHRVDYLHVELDSHDVLLAEGAPSESFVDDDSRGTFHNAYEFAALYPGRPRLPAVFCAPRAESGFGVERVRQRLAGAVAKAA